MGIREALKNGGRQKGQNGSKPPEPDSGTEGKKDQAMDEKEQEKSDEQKVRQRLRALGYLD